jgi:hypothetical protein
MAKKNNEVKENEELKNEVAAEVTEKVEEQKNEDVVTEKTETTAENATVAEIATVENATDIDDGTTEKATEETEKVPTVKEAFRDKYDDKVVYNVGDTFSIDESIEDNKPVKDGEKHYKVSANRYAELKECLYVD